MIYCQVRRYAETVQQNCLTQQNQRRKVELWDKIWKLMFLFEFATDFKKQSIQLFDWSLLKALIKNYQTRYPY